MARQLITNVGVGVIVKYFFNCDFVVCKVKGHSISPPIIMNPILITYYYCVINKQNIE